MTQSLKIRLLDEMDNLATERGLRIDGMVKLSHSPNHSLCAWMVTGSLIDGGDAFHCIITTDTDITPAIFNWGDIYVNGRRYPT